MVVNTVYNLKPKTFYVKHLFQLGYSVIPCTENKAPLSTEVIPYRERQTSPEEIVAWNKQFPNSNWAILTGKTPTPCEGITQGIPLVLVEADDQRGIEFIEEKCPPTPLTVQRIEYRKHFYYRRPESIKYPYLPGWSKLPYPDESINVDLRADGNMAVAPGSWHACGKPYIWSQEWTRELILSAPVYDPTWFPPTITPRKMEKPEPVEIDLTDCTLEMGERVRQFKRYLEGCPGTQSGVGAGANVTPYKLAIKGLKGFMVDKIRTHQLLCEWGQKSDNIDSNGAYHPWTSKEIKDKVESALLAEYTGTPGDMLHKVSTAVMLAPDAVETFPDAPATVAPATAAETIVAAPAVDATSTPAPSKSKFLTFHEVKAIGDTQVDDWLVPNWLQFRSLGMLCGAPFAGKSCLVAELLAGINKWGTFAGMPVPKVPTLVIDMENLERLRIGRLMRATEGDHECFRNQVYYQNDEVLRPPFDEKMIEDMIIDFKRETGCEKFFMVTDTFRSTFRLDEKDTEKMIGLLYPLQQVVRRHNIAGLILHHKPKSNTSWYSGDSSIAGALDYGWSWETDRDTRIGTLTLQGTRGEVLPDPLQFRYENARNVFISEQGADLERSILSTIGTGHYNKKTAVKEVQNCWSGVAPGYKKIVAEIDRLTAEGKIVWQDDHFKLS